MSYPQSGGLLSYFMPNVPLATTTAGVVREIDIGAASGDHGEYICTRPCTMLQTGFVVVGEIPVGTATAPTVIFKKRPTPLSATGETLISTLQITTSLPIGEAIVESISVDFAVGDSVEISWTIGVTGTVAGKGFAFANCSDKPEEPANNSEVTATI